MLALAGGCGCGAVGLPDAGTGTTGAAFDAAPSKVTFTVVKDITADGAGVVADASGSLGCGTACTSTSARFWRGASVTLEARPGPGSHFAGWSGACSGSYRFCTLSLATDETATARFAATTRNLVFVTAASYDGALGGLAGADQRCAEAAAHAGLTGRFVALLSSSSVDARDRLVTAAGVPAGSPVRLDGAPVYASVASVFDQHALWNAVTLDEDGKLLSSAADDPAWGQVWTGTLRDGTRDNNGQCRDWASSAGSSAGRIGDMEGGPRAWVSADAFGSCDQQSHLYCVMIDLAVDAAPSVAMGKAVYVTRRAFAPGGGIDAADQACAAEKPAGAADVQALLATTTTAAADRLDRDSLYVRPDGTPVGTGAEMIGPEPRLRSGIWQEGDGTYDLSATPWAWNGSDTLDEPGTAAGTCDDWRSAAYDAFAWTGAPGRERSWWGVGNRSCVNGLRLVCVEKTGH
jgi:hypothetical protein